MNITNIILIICLIVSIINLIILLSVSNFLIKFAASISGFNVANQEDFEQNNNANNEKGLIDV